MGLGAADDITEDAGWVAGMCQESAVVSKCVAVLGSADQEIGALVDGGSRGSDEIETGSNGGVPGDRAGDNMRASEHEIKRDST